MRHGIFAGAAAEELVTYSLLWNGVSGSSGGGYTFFDVQVGPNSLSQDIIFVFNQRISNGGYPQYITVDGVRVAPQVSSYQSGVVFFKYTVPAGVTAVPVHVKYQSNNWTGGLCALKPSSQFVVIEDFDYTVGSWSKSWTLPISKPGMLLSAFHTTGGSNSATFNWGGKTTLHTRSNDIGTWSLAYGDGPATVEVSDEIGAWSGMAAVKYKPSPVPDRSDVKLYTEVVRDNAPANLTVPNFPNPYFVLVTVGNVQFTVNGVSIPYTTVATDGPTRVSIIPATAETLSISGSTSLGRYEAFVLAVSGEHTILGSTTGTGTGPLETYTVNSGNEMTLLVTTNSGGTNGSTHIFGGYAYQPGAWRSVMSASLGVSVNPSDKLKFNHSTNYLNSGFGYTTIKMRRV